MSDVIDILESGTAAELRSDETALEALRLADEADPVPPLARVHERLPEKGVTVGLHRLLARALADANQIEEADRVQLSVVERLNQAGFWRALARAAAPLLERHPQQAAPLLTRARIQGGAEAVDDDLLERAHDLFPRHGVLGWKTAEARLARGDEKGARRAAAAALPELVEDKNHDVADEALLLLAEDTSVPTARALCRTLELLARQEDWDRFDTAVDLAGPALTTERGAALAWPVIRELWRRHPDRDVLRSAAARVVRVTLDSYPDPDAIVRISEIERPSQPADVVLERLRRAILFPPGYFARHMGWGIGKIRDNDTESLVVDFPLKPLHRMTLATAEKALDALAPDDLRVLMARDKERLLAMVREDPATVVVQALRTLKDATGTADDLRRVLVPEVLPSAGWAGWWKGAKAAAVADARIDARRAYENRFRLASDDDEDEVELPPWDVKRDLAKNLARFDVFLSHHPAEAARLLDAYRDRVTAAAGDPSLSAEVRAAAGLWLLKLDPDAAVHPETEVARDFDMNALNKADQEALLARVEGADALAAALNSRLAGIRREAWSRLRDSGELEAEIRSVLSEAAVRPEAALQVLEEGLPADEPPAGPAWTAPLLGAFLDLLEAPPRETHRKRALALMKPDSVVGRRLAADPITGDDLDPFTLRLKRWQGSDKVRFPLLAFLQEVGHGEISEVVEGHRARSAAKLGDRMGSDSDDPYEGDLVVTRPTLARLEAERQRVGMELKTIIPQAIQKAREHGDLRENAEYKAAKDKQANYAKRFEEIEKQLKSVRLIETLEREPGRALPGTELTLSPAGTDGEDLVLWLLGEGDQALGDGVVSYKAPVGQAVYRKRVGDEVDIPGPGGVRRYRLKDVRERLP